MAKIFENSETGTQINVAYIEKLAAYGNREYAENILSYAEVEVNDQTMYLTTAINQGGYVKALALGELYRICKPYPGLADAVIANARDYAEYKARVASVMADIANRK